MEVPLPLHQIRHDAKFEKISPAAMLKNIGDKLAGLLYGAGKTLGTSVSGIRGEAQTLLISKNKLKEARFVVYVKSVWLEDKQKNVGRHHVATSSLDAKELYRCIASMVSHASKNGVNIVVIAE